jgi:hypothetical protein
MRDDVALPVSPIPTMRHSKADLNRSSVHYALLAQIAQRRARGSGRPMTGESEVWFGSSKRDAALCRSAALAR